MQRFESFTLRKCLAADMAYAFDCKSKEGSSNLQQDSVKKMFETDEFDSEEIEINQKICDKQTG
jgi:hypothetical protein